MSRAAVLAAIITDSTLGGLGFNIDNVHTNFAAKQRPTDKMFISLNWGQHNIDRRFGRGPRDLTIWVHMFRGFSTDYARIDEVIEALDSVLTDMINVPGADGYTVTQIEAGVKSRDLKDGGYETLCRSATYSVLSRKT